MTITERARAILFWVLRALYAPIDALNGQLVRLLLRRAAAFESNGIKIVIDPRTDPSGENTTMYEARLTGALDTIGRYQPRDLGQLRRAVRVILVSRPARQKAASYWARPGALMIHPKHIWMSSSETLAVDLIGLLVEARFELAGITAYAARPRVAWRMHTARIAFAERLPAGIAAAGKSPAKLQSPLFAQLRPKGQCRADA